MRPNTQYTLFPSATREPGTMSEVTSTANARGVLLTVHAESTTGDGTQDLQVAVKAPHEQSGQAVTLVADELTGGATGLRQYLLYPGVVDTQGVYAKVQGTPPPEDLEVEVTVTPGGDASYTFSVTAEVILE